MTPRTFDYSRFVADWRGLAADHGLDPVTGERLAAQDTGWWRNPILWHDPGIAHSVVEAEAIRNISAEARASCGVKPPVTLAQAMTDEFRQIVREVLREEITVPLSELHRRRGVTVETIEGMRVEVKVRIA